MRTWPFLAVGGETRASRGEFPPPPPPLPSEFPVVCDREDQYRCLWGEIETLARAYSTNSERHHSLLEFVVKVMSSSPSQARKLPHKPTGNLITSTTLSNLPLQTTHPHHCPLGIKLLSHGRTPTYTSKWKRGISTMQIVVMITGSSLEVATPLPYQGGVAMAPPFQFQPSPLGLCSPCGVPRRRAKLAAAIWSSQGEAMERRQSCIHR